MNRGLQKLSLYPTVTVTAVTLTADHCTEIAVVKAPGRMYHRTEFVVACTVARDFDREQGFRVKNTTPTIKRFFLVTVSNRDGPR